MEPAFYLNDFRMYLKQNICNRYYCILQNHASCCERSQDVLGHEPKGFCQSLRILCMCHGHKHCSATVKMPVCYQHSVTNPNHRTTKDTIKKIISVWARPSIVYFCINFSVRWEPGFIFDLEHYERKEAMVFGTELLQHSDCSFFLLCVSLIWMAKRN